MAVLLRNNKGEREGGDRSETVEHNEQKKTRVGKNSLSKLSLQKLFMYQTTHSIFHMFLPCYIINFITCKDKNVFQKFNFLILMMKKRRGIGL